MFSLVGARVDALTQAFRVALDDELVAELRARRTLARRHGRCAFVWKAPPELVGRGRELGDVGAVWSHLAERRPVVGELGPTQAGTYRIKRSDIYRLQIKEHGDGAIRLVHDVTGEIVEEPGWNVEIIWEAMTLAEWGIDKCLAEGAAIAWSFGVVKEQAVRRFDLCADVAGWEIHPEDADCIVKRPRASYDVASDASELDELGESHRRLRLRGKPRPHELAGPTTHEHGKPGQRRVCGLSIGTGGALMARLYNKVLELSLAGREKKRAVEHARWRENGWDGVTPVTRVEFQVRGAAIKELGLRDPEAVRETIVDEATGKSRGQRILKDADGRPLTLAERLPWVWSTMLRWVRMVVPDRGQRFACRLETQWRWKFLELVTFGVVSTIKRCRVRGVASEAQALGVALSQAAKAGELDEAAATWSEKASDYGRESAEATLRERIARLERLQTARIVAWLIERCKKDPVDACVHLATLARGKWAKHLEWEVADNEQQHERGPPSAARRVQLAGDPAARGSPHDPFSHWAVDRDLARKEEAHADGP